MKTDLYNPANGAHYLASPSQLRALEAAGWVVYADWLAQQDVAPAPEPEPEPEPVVAEATDFAETVPAPTL